MPFPKAPKYPNIGCLEAPGLELRMAVSINVGSGSKVPNNLVFRDPSVPFKRFLERALGLI